MPYLLCILSYLLGSVPFGLLFARTVGVDIRAQGSGNIGATNVNRLLGRKLGILTLLADAGKGAVPVVVAGLLLRDLPARDIWAALCGGSAFLGHLFPVYLRFKGGKGVATALGVFLALAPAAVGGAVVIFVAVVAFSGYVSLGSICAASLMPAMAWMLGSPPPVVFLAVFFAILIVLRHWENIGRLLKGEEKSWRGTGRG